MGDINGELVADLTRAESRPGFLDLKHDSLGLEQEVHA